MIQYLLNALVADDGDEINKLNSNLYLFYRRFMTVITIIPGWIWREGRNLTPPLLFGHTFSARL